MSYAIIKLIRGWSGASEPQGCYPASPIAVPTLLTRPVREGVSNAQTFRTHGSSSAKTPQILGSSSCSAPFLVDMQQDAENVVQAFAKGHMSDLRVFFSLTWPLLLGNSLAWYEFGVYGYVEKEISENFFGSSQAFLGL